MTHDILIIGGGPAGLSFGCEAAQAGLRVAVIERQAESVLADPPYDGREIALTHRSRKIMTGLGMWDCLPPETISPIKAAKVMNGRSPYALSFDRAEAGEDALGFMVSNHQIRKAAYACLKRQGERASLLTGLDVTGVGADERAGSVSLSDGTRMNAPLVVAADSRFSAARRMMGIPVSMLDFGRTCIVCTMSTELPHDETAYECFHFDRTLAILPLGPRSVSVVITLAADEARSVLEADADTFARDIERRCEGRLGTMALSSALFPYPLVATFAKRFCARRFALVGDAAVGMHPVTAHGFNLGLRGAHTLAGEIKSALNLGLDFASNGVLERYSRTHRHNCAPLYHGTNALVRLYTKDSPAAKLARGALLRLGNHIKPAKRLILQQLTETEAA